MSCSWFNGAIRPPLRDDVSVDLARAAADHAHDGMARHLVQNPASDRGSLQVFGEMVKFIVRCPPCAWRRS
jgi:hypothetical protein